jgi:hypothetical protein
VIRPPGGPERLAWTWKSSAAVAKADFGNPSVSTSLALCLYEDTGGPPALRMNARIPADGACVNNLCWRDLPSGYRYRDRRLTPDGIRNLILKAGDVGRGRIRARGKGANLDLPPFLTPPLLVQLQRTDTSQCWEATFSIATRNDGPRFVARSD